MLNFKCGGLLDIGAYSTT